MGSFPETSTDPFFYRPFNKCFFRGELAPNKLYTVSRNQETFGNHSVACKLLGPVHYGGEELREGEVPHLPVVKESFSSYATPGQWSEVKMLLFGRGMFVYIPDMQVLLETPLFKSHVILYSLRYFRRSSTRSYYKGVRHLTWSVLV